MARAWGKACSHALSLTGFYIYETGHLPRYAEFRTCREKMTGSSYSQPCPKLHPSSLHLTSPVTAKYFSFSTFLVEVDFYFYNVPQHKSSTLLFRYPPIVLILHWLWSQWSLRFTGYWVILCKIFLFPSGMPHGKTDTLPVTVRKRMATTGS